jgi:hypothetical protein
LTDDIRIDLIDTALYTYDAAHEFLDDVITGGSPADPTIGPYQILAGKTSTSGVADATDPVFPSVTGATVEAVVISKWTGDAATSPLIAYLDDAAGLPFTPAGIDETVVFDNGTNKIFML